jgi:hypothetical protein
MAPVAATPNEVPREKFWFVWKVDGMAPRKRHATLKAAQTEAARLRRIAPEAEFLAYEATLVDQGARA